MDDLVSNTIVLSCFSESLPLFFEVAAFRVFCVFRNSWKRMSESNMSCKFLGSYCSHVPESLRFEHFTELLITNESLKQLTTRKVAK